MKGAESTERAQALSSGLRAKDGLLGRRNRSGSGVGADSVAGADEEPDYNQVKSPPVYEILWFIGMLMAAPEVAVTAREGGAKSVVKIDRNLFAGRPTVFRERR